MSEIKLVQAPIIKHDLYSVGQSVTQRLKDLNIKGQVATEETVGALKKLRAELNKELAEFEAQRKAIKEAVMDPYSELESVYKTEVSDKYKDAGEMLKNKIAEVEDRIKSNTLEEVKSYFVELCLSESIDFLSFNQLGIEIKLSDSMKSYKDRINAFVGKVVDELNLIDTQENKAEILVEYKKTLNAAKAIKDIMDRKQAEKLEAERIKYAEINRRIALIHNIPMVYRDITRTYEFDEEIYITEDFLQNSTKDKFTSKIAEIKEFVKLEKLSLMKPVETIQPSAPLQAPTVETPKVQEETVIAAFEAQGTITQLRGLGEYMRINQITYKNI